MEETNGQDTERCEDKRKAPSNSPNSKSKKPWGTDGPPPAEWIEMSRQKKLLRVAQREKRRIEKGLPDPKEEGHPNSFNDNFIQRPMLSVPGVSCEDGTSKRITIMTYNVLAQSLIRRQMYPSSGNTLKWKNRSRMLTKELTHYNPTILSLQEVDLEQYDVYFKPLLESMDYDHVLIAGRKKRQGLLIAWKKKQYELSSRKNIIYDHLNAGTVGPTMWTGNVGLCLGLKEKNDNGKGIWVSNTHLYWHPRGSYERQRQAGILVSETVKQSATQPTWPIFVCGDFNSTPSGMTYTALTQRPIMLTAYQENELSQSIAFDFRNAKDEEDDIMEDLDLDSTATNTPIEGTDDTPSKPPLWKTKEFPQQTLLEEEEKPLSIASPTLENNSLVLAHHAANPPLKSLYSVGLSLCQPDNAINSFGEPPFTNWAQGYRETLDYIFTVEGEARSPVKLVGLLKMPRREEMGEGEPLEGRFPSDHVCEMVEVELQ